MQLNRNTKLFLVDPRNGDLTVMSMQSFHNYLVGSNYQAGNDFDVEVYTTLEEAESTASIYKQADTIRIKLIQLLKNKTDDSSKTVNAITAILN